MSRITGKKHYAQIMFILLIFMLFTFSGVSALLLAVNSYRNIIQSETETATYRNKVSYLREVIHQKDIKGQISVKKIDGNDALVIDVSEDFAQYIYASDGYLRELLAKKDADISLDFGEKIMEAESLDITMDGNVLDIKVTDTDGTVYSSAVSIKTGGGK